MVVYFKENIYGYKIYTKIYDFCIYVHIQKKENLSILTKIMRNAVHENSNCLDSFQSFLLSKYRKGRKSWYITMFNSQETILFVQFIRFDKVHNLDVYNF